MSDTKIDPLKFKELSVSQYKRFLLKDLARLSRTSSFKNYVYLYNYKMGSKRTDILLFADPEDEAWAAVIKKARSEAKKEAAGVCKIVQAGDRDQDGDEDYTLGIKTAQGSLKKTKVIGYVNDRLFENDPDVEAVLIKDLKEDGIDEDLEDEAILAKRKTEAGSGGFAKALNKTEFLKETGIKERTGSDAEKHPTMKAFLDAIANLFKGKTAENIFKSFQSGLSELESQSNLAVDDPEVFKNQVIEKASILQEALDSLENKILRVIECGNIWLEGPGKKFHFGKTHGRKKEAVKTQILHCNQLLKQLIKFESRIDDLFEDAFMASYKVYSNLSDKSLEQRKKSATGILDIIAEWQRQNSSSQDPQTKARNKKLQGLKAKLLAAIVNIDLELVECETQARSLDTAFRRYQIKYDPFRVTMGSRGSAESTETLVEKLDNQKRELLNVYKSIAKWKKDYPEIHSPEQEARYREINNLYRKMDAEYKALQKEIKTQSRFEKYKVGTQKEKEALLRDPSFISSVNRELPLSEYVESFQNNTMYTSIMSPQTIDLSDLPGTQFVDQPNPELDVYYYFSTSDILKKSSKVGSNPEVIEEVNYTKDVWLRQKHVKKQGQKYILAEFKEGPADITLYVESKPSETPYKDVSDRPLFGLSGKPKISHVRQSDIGDCWLMAAMGSLVSKSPNKVQRMLFDDGKGHVYVRLFEVTERQEVKVINGVERTVPAFTFTARIVRVKKEVPKKAYNEESGLWVKMIEKAWVAAGLAGNLGKSSGGKHQTIESGYAGFALLALTGEYTESGGLRTYLEGSEALGNQNFVMKGYDIDGPMYATTPWSNDEWNNLIYSRDNGYKGTLSHEIFNGDIETIEQWIDFVGEDTFKRLFEREFSEDYSGEVTLEDLEDLLNGKFTDADGTEDTSLPQFDNAAGKRAMMKWIKSHRLYPGKLGTGKYSMAQESTYELVRKALKDDRRIVVLDAKDQIASASEVTGLGDSGGEEKAFGLAGKHSYSAIDCKLDKGDGLLYLKIRNPWGNYSRNYLKASKAKEILDTRLAKKLKDTGGTYSAYTKDDLKDLDNLTVETHLQTAGIEDNSEVKKWMKERLIISSYDPDKLIPFENESSTDKGESWIELSEITKRFKSIHVN